MLIGARLNWLLSHGKGRTWGDAPKRFIHIDIEPKEMDSNVEIAAPLAQTEGHRRELFFWTAQSFYEVGDFALSAAYYLESARLAGERNPFWEKSAKFSSSWLNVSPSSSLPW